MRHPFLPYAVLIVTILAAEISRTQPISWQQLTGPNGGTAFCFLRTASGDLFAGSGQNQRGAYRSTNGGATWQQASGGMALTDRAVTWFAVDDSGFIVAGTKSHIGDIVYKSRDQGGSWSAIANLGGTSCAISDSGHLYVGNTAYGQYSVSRDAGYSWTLCSAPSGFVNCLAINDSGHLFIGGNYTGYRSTDNGASWTTMTLPDGINSIAFGPNGYVFAGCSREYASTSGVFRSTNNGASWAAAKEGFRVYASDNIVLDDSGHIYVGSWGTGVWRSTDNGDTWQQRNTGLGHFYVRAMHASRGLILAGLDGGGIYSSTNGGASWTQVGINVSSVRSIAVQPGGGNILAAVSGISRSIDHGASWVPMNAGLGNYDTRAFLFTRGGTLFCGAGSNYSGWGVILRLPEDSTTWERADAGIPGGTHVNALAAGAGDTVYAGTSKGVYKSGDNGTSWTNIGPASTALDVRAVAITTAGDFFVACWGQGVYRRLSADTLWTQLLTGYFGSLYIAKNGYVFTESSRSTDNGASWTTVSGFKNRTSSFVENSLGHLFAGTYDYGTGVYRSTDGGAIWTNVSSGIPVPGILALAVDEEDYLYAGTDGYSIYKTTAATVTSAPDEGDVPSAYKLGQNYPNPFNPTTRIGYQLPAAGTVRLVVYDLLGREVAVLVNERKAPGSHEAQFDATGVASGVYLYRMTAGSYVQTRKLLLVR